MKWDDRFLSLALHIASWSKDPSTQVGAVIVDDQHRIIGTGYNGFPRGIRDDAERYENRELKYKMVVHAEVNAILNATGSVKGCTLYTWPLPTCADCAKIVIQSGIKRVVSRYDVTKTTRWAESLKLASEMYREAGVEEFGDPFMEYKP